LWKVVHFFSYGCEVCDSDVTAGSSEISRFPDAKKLCAYAGLVPSVSQSGARTIYGHITKQGNRWIRFVLVEAVQRTITIQPDSPLSAMYQRIKARKGSAIAKVACARKLPKII